MTGAMIFTGGILFISLCLTCIIRYLHKRILGGMTTKVIFEISGQEKEPPMTIKEMYEHLDYFRWLRDEGVPIDENGLTYNKKDWNKDVAYQ